MPETSVNKDRDTFLDEIEVRAAGNTRDVTLPATEAEPH
jgi:hypothetical protein